MLTRPVPFTRVAAPALGVALALVGLASVAVVCGGSLRFGAMLHATEQGDIRSLRVQLQAAGTAAVGAVLVLAIAHTVLPFPAELLAAAAGFALGVPLALPTLLVGLLISAVITYLIGAHLGRPVAAAVVGWNRLSRAESFVERGGVQALIVLRLCPLLPFGPVCLACGLARVPLRRYLWTTAVGVLPELTLVTFLGSRLENFSLGRPEIWVPLIGLLGLIVVGTIMMRCANPGKHRPAD